MNSKKLNVATLKKWIRVHIPLSDRMKLKSLLALTRQREIWLERVSFSNNPDSCFYTGLLEESDLESFEKLLNDLDIKIKREFTLNP